MYEEIENETLLYERLLTLTGYVKLKIGGRWIFEHRYIVEKFIGRELSSEEVIHHINKNKQHNNLDNLWLFENEREHQKFHIKLKRYGYYTQPMLTAMKNRWDKYNDKEEITIN